MKKAIEECKKSYRRGHKKLSCTASFGNAVQDRDAVLRLTGSAGEF